MPGLDGFELSAKIKESPETSAIKVLLLASDFEEFDEQRYQECGADNHISKPFKSDDIVAMVKSLLGTSDEGSVELTDKTVSDQNASEPEPSLEELLASVEELSAEGGEFSSPEGEATELTEEESLELMANIKPMGLPEAPEPLENPVGLEPEEEVEVLSGTDDDIMDPLIRGVEELRESVQSPGSPEEEVFPFEEEEPDSERPQEEVLVFAEEPEIFAEIRPHKLDNLDELDSTFKEIVMGGSPAHHEEQAHSAELSSLGGIVPEPENLLERIAPGAFSEVGKRPATPEDIKENLDAISGFSDQSQGSLHYNLRSENWDHEAGPLTQAIADEVRQLLQRSLGSSLEKEVSGLSEAILRTVREVVREITPEIARRVIREEIEKIKKQDMY